MYRTAIEGILGIHVRGQTLEMDPCIPRGWTSFEFTYRFGTSNYTVAVENPQGVSRGVRQTFLDGTQMVVGPRCEIALVDDGLPHALRVVMG